MPMPIRLPSNAEPDCLLSQNYGSFLTTEESALRSEFRSKSHYYSMMARAVSRLPNNTREARQALYDRAAIALASELRDDPEVSDKRAAFERLALEGVMRKLESDELKKRQPKEFEQKRRRPLNSLFRVFKSKN